MKHDYTMPLNHRSLVTGRSGFAAARSDDREDTSSKVERSIAYMADHISQPLQVATLAAMANVSPSHFFLPCSRNGRGARPWIILRGCGCAMPDICWARLLQASRRWRRLWGMMIRFIFPAFSNPCIRFLRAGTVPPGPGWAGEHPCKLFPRKLLFGSKQKSL